MTMIVITSSRKIATTIIMATTEHFVRRNLGQDNPDQADSVVKFNSVTSGITVTAIQTTTIDIP
ncbi:MAG: hypothetical protein ACHQDD_05520 [Steroidobacterales bacterium]